MASVLALVSKGAFEKDHPRASLGAVLGFTLYASSNRALETLAEGGDLYLVTVRSNEEPWLVAVLRAPRRSREAWRAAENEVPVTNVKALLGALRFSTGKGISAEPGKLAMSLQTPRALTHEDVAKLEALIAGKSKARPVSAPSPPPPTPPAPASKGAPSVGTPWAAAPPRPASVPAEAVFDDLDRRWIEGTRGPDGARTGAWREWREDGSLYLKTHYVGGLTHGDQPEFHPDGSPAMEAKWVAGVQKETTAYRCKSGETDFAMWKDIHPRVVRVVSVPDDRGLGWRTGMLFDESGAEVGPTGEPIPPRPAGVPATARYLMLGDVPAWIDGATQYTTHLPIGRRRVWSPAGVLLEESEYTSWGRLVWKRAGLDPDPQAARIDAFMADPITFSPGYQLGQHWTPDVHDLVRARLREASTAHVAAYLELLTERVEWHLEELAPRGLTACGLDIVADWLGRGTKTERAKENGAAAVYAWALERRLDLFDRAAVRELLSSSRAILEADETDHAKLLEKAKALAEGKAERELDAIAARLASSRASLTADDLLRLARRALRASDLCLWLGDPTKGECLLRDELGRAFLFDGATFAAIPLAIDTSERRNTAHFQALDTCDERRLFLSGQHVWWTFTRYGWTVHVQGSHYFSSRGQGESILSGLVRCPDASWVDRVRAIFQASVPAAAVEIGPFAHEKKGWLFAWAYDSSLVHPFGHELSRGVDGKTLVNTTRHPGVLRLEMIAKKADAKPRPVKECASEEDAIERFNRFEVTLLRNGYRLDRVVTLPLREPVKAAKPKGDDARKATKAAVPVREVAASVAKELTAARDANELGKKIAALRAAWVKRPVPALADALDALGEEAPPLPEIAGKSKAALAAWDAVEKKRDPSTLGRLLGSLTDVPSTVIQPRLERLAEWPADPRLDRALIEIAWTIPFTSSGTQSVWRRIFARLKASEDARILERLRGLSKRYKKEWNTVTGAWAREVVEKIAEERGPALEALGALTLEAGDAELLVLTRKRADGGVSRTNATDELLAKILASPDDHALRLAYAEAAGPTDIRAEHILLSSRRDTLDKAGRARLAEIERDHVAELAGPLAKYLKKGARFDRGFLVEAERLHGIESSEELVASPWWSTVEVLDVGFDPLLQRSPTLLSVRVLDSVAFALGHRGRAASIEASPPRPRVTSLSLAVHEFAALTELFRSEKFPALTEITMSLRRVERPTLDWLDQPATTRLTRIGIAQEVAGGGGAVDRTSIDWLSQLWMRARTSLPNLRTIAGEIVYNSRVDLRIDRTSDATSELSVRSASKLHGWLHYLQDNLCALLEALGPIGCRKAHVDVKLATDAFVAAVNESARLGGVAIEWGKAKS